MISVEQLAVAAEEVLACLREAGFQLRSRELFATDSFKGGFLLTFTKCGTVLSVQYLDMEFEAHVDNRELFGAAVHPGFSGHVFSREHLLEHLPRLARAVTSQFTGNLSRAV